MAKLHELHFELLPHPPDSPDLARSDYYLFPNLKRWLLRIFFESDEDLEWETDAYFGGLQKSYYERIIEKLEDRWNKCIALRGD